MRRSLLCVGLVVAGCLGSAAAQAQSDDTLIGEMVRRATAGENEDGFCTQVGWPRSPGGSVAVPAFIAYLQSAKVGTWKANTFDNGNCQYDKVTDVTNENGGKCVVYTYWACTKGSTCGIGHSTDCVSESGKLMPRKGDQ